MSTFLKFILWFLLSTINIGEANKDVTQQQRGTRATSKTSIDVVSLSFCKLDFPAEDKHGKKTLEEVHTYAELKHDPRASLLDSLTVCSAIMATDCQQPQWAASFNILNKNSGQFLAPSLIQGNLESIFAIGFHEGLLSQMVTGKTPTLFPNQWTRSCMAVNQGGRSCASVRAALAEKFGLGRKF